MTHNELTRMIMAMGQARREETVNALLAGNDVQCFTTEQYLKKRYKHKDLMEDKDYRFYLHLSRHALENYSGLVEVKPNVWALVQSDAEDDETTVC